MPKRSSTDSGTKSKGQAGESLLMRPRLSLTDNEATLLALVARGEPITAYQISKVYEGSPVSNFNTSTGKIYPIIKRLKAANYVRALLVEGDARGTEQLVTTSEGKEALRAWIKEIRPAHLLPEDPLRTKVQSFELLSRDERIEWISHLKMRLLEKLESVEEYGREEWAPYQHLVHENAVRVLRTRMDWLDIVLSRAVQEKN